MGWKQLGEIIKENKQKAFEDKSKPITECPECFFTLREDAFGNKLCPLCGWREK